MSIQLLDKMFKIVVESLPLFIIVDAAGNIVYLNDQYCEMFGLKREETIGKYIRDVIKRSRLPIVLKNGEPELKKLFYLDQAVKPEYRDRYLINNLVPLIDDGKIIGAYAITLFFEMDPVDELLEEVKRLSQKNKAYRDELQNIREEQFALERPIGSSPRILNVKKTIEQFAETDLSILLTGETGTGKEIWAKAIHLTSQRWDKPYVKVNCSALPNDLLESELFGYEAGAFSGASRSGKIGKFELANHGTILLDEIGNMPFELQSKLLRVIQEKELERLGGTKTIPLDIRIICSTNQNLRELVYRHNFRQDLYYRINTIEIELPPLREHIEDIPELCNFFINKINKNYGINISGINPSCLEHFSSLRWQGNIRELEHVLERACLSKLNGILHPEDINFLTINNDNNINKKWPNYENIDYQPSFSAKKSNLEKLEIINALKEAKGNKTLAAQILQIHRSVLYRKMKKYNIY